MKKSTLLTIQDKLKSKSKQPWAAFETDGFSDDGVGIGMFWNSAFISHLHANGVQGATDEETMQLFFLFMASRVAESVVGENTVSAENTPNLTNEANAFIR